MIKCLVKRKVHNEIKKNNKKILMCSALGVTCAGVGIYFTCKAVKKCMDKYDEDFEQEYLKYLQEREECSDYDKDFCIDKKTPKKEFKSEVQIDESDYIEFETDRKDEKLEELEKSNKEKDELKERVEKFNEKRLSYENEEHPDPEQIEKVIQKTKDDKEKVKIQEYKTEKYEELQDDK